MKEMRVLVYTDAELGVFVGQCVDFDVCVQARTVAQIRQLLSAQVSYHEKMNGGVASLPPRTDFFKGEWDTTEGDPERMLIGDLSADFKILPKSVPAVIQDFRPEQTV